MVVQGESKETWELLEGLSRVGFLLAVFLAPPLWIPSTVESLVFMVLLDI